MKWGAGILGYGFRLPAVDFPEVGGHGNMMFFAASKFIMGCFVPLSKT
jgi:hypothetical protein